MNKTIQVTVVFPQTFTIEIEDVENPTEDDIQSVKDYIKDYAGYLMEGSESDPIITDCDDERFVD